MTERLRKTEDAWVVDPGGLPDWLTALVEACDRASQNKVAKNMGYSGTVVSQVLSNSYPGDMEKIERAVRDFYMVGFTCPALGKITPQNCQDWRKQADDPSPSSMMKARMYRACVRCHRYRKANVDGADK